MGHYGYLRTTQTYDDFAKHHDELQRHHDMINGDGSWIGVRRARFSVCYSVFTCSSESRPCTDGNSPQPNEGARARSKGISDAPSDL